MGMKGNYIILDECILSDDKIRDLIESRGYEGLGVYIALLTLMRNFSSYDYKIPLSSIRKIASWDLHMPEEELKSFINSCIACNLFKVDESFFWSARRRNSLISQEKAEKEMSERNTKNIQKRWQKKEL